MIESPEKNPWGLKRAPGGLRSEKIERWGYHLLFFAQLYGEGAP